MDAVDSASDSREVYKARAVIAERRRILAALAAIQGPVIRKIDIERIVNGK